MSIQPTKTVNDYRSRVSVRGDKPKTVWGVVRNGQLIDWYLNKRHAENAATRQFDTTVEKVQA